MDAKKTITGKVTKHKIAVLNLFNLHRHLDANQIYNILNNDAEKVSLATIYRILSSFEKEGVILKNNFIDEQAVYELSNSLAHHDHFICTKCSAIIEFYNEELENLQNKIAAEFEFQVSNHHLNIYGICKNCC